MDKGTSGMHHSTWFIGKVLLPIHAAKSVENVLSCLTECSWTVVRTITIKTVTTISVHTAIMAIATIVVL
jgi:hypothetical protein